MEDSMETPSQPSVITVVETAYANPFADATNRFFQYLDTVIITADDIRVFIIRRAQENIPAWVLEYSCTLLNFSLKTSLFLFVSCWLGIFAYETSFYCFKTLGLMTQEHRSLFNNGQKKLEDELEGMTLEEKEKRQVLVEGKEKLNVEVERGARWLWGPSLVFFTARMFFTERSYYAKLLLGLLETFALFNIGPLITVVISRLVVPKAYLAGPWLCEKDTFAGDGATKEAKSTARAGINDPRMEEALRQRKSARNYVSKIDYDAELLRPEYLSEAKRVGYGRRSTLANRQGGL